MRLVKPNRTKYNQIHSTEFMIATETYENIKQMNLNSSVWFSRNKFVTGSAKWFMIDTTK